MHPCLCMDPYMHRQLRCASAPRPRTSSFVPQEDQKYWTKKDVLDALTSPSISEHRWAEEPAALVSNSLRGGQRVSAAIAYEGEGCPENRMGITEHDASCARIHVPAFVDHLVERLLERVRPRQAWVALLTAEEVRRQDPCGSRLDRPVADETDRADLRRARHRQVPYCRRATGAAD